MCNSKTKLPVHKANEVSQSNGTHFIEIHAPSAGISIAGLLIAYPMSCPYLPTTYPMMPFGQNPNIEITSTRGTNQFAYESRNRFEDIIENNETPKYLQEKQESHPNIKTPKQETSWRHFKQLKGGDVI